MGGKGSGGGGTSFESMSHEQMLAWLDQANSGHVQAAADRLVAAATEIRRIADELKVRPQWVRWKGEGASAFRTWSGDLANSTLRLGDFSEESAKWLSRASEAIATAQASIPRDKGAAQGNLAAAQANPNDPDARAVGGKSADELERIAAGKEKVRQEAAAEMRKLGQAYRLAAGQLEGLERPRFRPLPDAVLPAPRTDLQTKEPTGGPTAAPSRAAGPVGGPSSEGAPRSPIADDRPSGVGVGPDAPGSVQRPPAPQAPEPVAVEPVGVEIDGTATLPPTSPTPSANPGGPPSGVKPDTGTTPPIGTFPPTSGTRPNPPMNPAIPPGPGRAGPGGRSPVPPGRGPVGPVPARGLPPRPVSPPAPTRPVVGGPPSASPVGPKPDRGPGASPPMPSSPPGPVRPVVGGAPSLPSGRPTPGPAPGRDGVVGGRPMPLAPGPSGGPPRGTVIGGPHGAGTGPGGSGSGRASETPGQRPLGASNGVAGGQPRRQPGGGGARAFTSGGSGLVRGKNPSGSGTPSTPSVRNAVPPNASQPPRSRRDEERNGRPDYLTEDEETWLPNSRRVVPPVID